MKIYKNQKLFSNASKRKFPYRNRAIAFIFFLLDWILLKCVSIKKITHDHPKKILISNIAHIGDGVLTTALLPVLKAAYPDAKIGVLIGSWSRQIFEQHPMVATIHCFDHWKVNRRAQTRLKKIVQTFKMGQHVLKELRQQNYDIAIDCCFYYPNSAYLTWRANIPTRVGFESAGFGSLLTHPFSWNITDNLPAPEAYFKLLQPFKLESYYPLLTPSLKDETHCVKENYILLHIGSGGNKKSWPIFKWKELATRLVAEGEQVVFTGAGSEEQISIQFIIEGLEKAQSLCNKLDVGQWIEKIGHASLLVGVDSSAGHIAASLSTPSVLLYTGISPCNIWRPYKGNSLVISHDVPCAPCFKGCSAMTCIRSIPVETVYQAIRKIKHLQESYNKIKK